MKAEIKKLIEQAVKKIGAVETPNFSVEAPSEGAHGDYSTNVAMALAKQLKKNPLEVAKEIAARLSHDSFEKIEVAPPGFINFYLAPEFFVEELKKIDKYFGSNENLKGKKIIVEYTDPNILKEFHIGHLMSNVIGESLSRLFEFQGATIKRVNYQGDVGMHVAKAVWGYMNLEASANASEIGKWAAAYRHGAAAYEMEDKGFKQEIELINKKIYDRSDAQINKLYDQGKKESLKYFDDIYKKLGTKFDHLFFESETAPIGKAIVEDGLEKGVFQKGEKGAIIFKGEEVGLHTRVFINSEALPTYEAKDLALPKLKYQYFAYDTSIIITASEQNAYFSVMLAALKQLAPELAEKTHHIGHGMMRLPEGKMASRAGKAILAEMLIEKAKELIFEKTKDRKLGEGALEQIALGAIKYSVLKQSLGSDIIYDFEKSISFEGDSGPYLQYSYARSQSVLRKAKDEKIKASLKNSPAEISSLEKMMVQFPEIVQKAAVKYEPHVITLYLTELAREFNNYYAHHKIVDKDDEFSPYKVALTQAFSVIMKNGLWLLGIEAPEKM